MAQESEKELLSEELAPVLHTDAPNGSEELCEAPLGHEEPSALEETVETPHGEVTLPVLEPEAEVPAEPVKKPGRLRSLSNWVEQRATSVVSRIYESQADDLEERAKRVVGTAYQEKAADLQSRAQKALQQAIADQAEIIKEAIEHGVEVKKREVRLSLLVLVAGSLIYLFLYWLTAGSPAA